MADTIYDPRLSAIPNAANNEYAAARREDRHGAQFPLPYQDLQQVRPDGLRCERFRSHTRSPNKSDRPANC